MKYLITALVAVVAFFLPSVGVMAIFYVLGVPFNPNIDVAGALTLMSFGMSYLAVGLTLMEFNK